MIYIFVGSIVILIIGFVLFSAGMLAFLFDFITGEFDKLNVSRAVPQDGECYDVANEHIFVAPETGYYQITALTDSIKKVVISHYKKKNKKISAKKITFKKYVKELNR